LSVYVKHLGNLLSLETQASWRQLGGAVATAPCTLWIVYGHWATENAIPKMTDLNSGPSCGWYSWVLPHL